MCRGVGTSRGLIRRTTAPVTGKETVIVRLGTPIESANAEAVLENIEGMVHAQKAKLLLQAEAYKNAGAAVKNGGHPAIALTRSEPMHSTHIKVLVTRKRK